MVSYGTAFTGLFALSVALFSIIFAAFTGKAPPVSYPSAAPASSEPGIKVDVNRLQEQIDILAKISDHPEPDVTRILFTKNDVAARRFIVAQMQAIGLKVREDAIGNIFGRWEGSMPDAAAVLTGSHTDAIPHAGKYDGVLGVLGGIEAIAALKASGFKPRRSLEVLMFTSEEPTRFGYGCLGSRTMANQEGFLELIASMKDKNGTTFAEAAAGAGHPGALQQLSSVIVKPDTYSSFVELHIEQGPFLEAEGIPIGVVTAIAAPAALTVEFKGDGGHAGGQLMPDRNDAGLAAAELALAVEAHVLATGSIDTVGTAGKVELLPNAINSVPRDAHIEIDVRDIDGARRDSVVASIKNSAEEIAAKRKVQLVQFSILNADPPATCSPVVVNAAAASAKELGLKYKLMVSRAYHDSLFMSRIAPTGMIFIPCLKGFSHRPDEFASKVDMEHGVHVLALTLAKLSLQ